MTQPTACSPSSRPAPRSLNLSAPPSPPPIAAPSPKPGPLLAQARLPQKLATVSQQLALRIRPARAQGQCRPAGLRRGACCKSFAVIPRRRGADVPGRGTAAHSRQSHARRAHPRQDQQRPGFCTRAKPLAVVNAANWGLITGKLVATHSESPAWELAQPPDRRGRRARSVAGGHGPARMMGEQFVTGETIDEAPQRLHDGGRGFRLFVRHAGRGR